MTEPYEHCQCDNCSGVDCGQDNPEECERLEKERIAVIRKEERERILDLIDKWGIENKTSVDYTYYDGLLYLCELQEYIKSLRICKIRSNHDKAL
jgi:hypothetical protein